MSTITPDQCLLDRSVRSVFVSNIPPEAIEENLKEVFSEVGPILSFKLATELETGKSKGYGFCEYKDQETALSAIRNLNGCEFSGKNLRVESAATEKCRMEMQLILQGQNIEFSYADVIQSDKAPEAISKAVASLPAEQMFELMKQMKLCVQNNPNEARQMLLQNPQLAYALLQALVVMRIVDPHSAVSLLQKASPISQVTASSDKPALHTNVSRGEESWPLPKIASASNSASIFNTSVQDVDLRMLDRQIDPRLARLDQDLRAVPQAQPTPVSAPTNIPVDSRGTGSFNVTENVLPADGIESFSRDPRTDRFTRDPRDPRDSRDPREPRDPRDPREARDPREPREPRESRDPRISTDPRMAKTAASTSATPPSLPRPVAAPIVPPPSVVTASASSAAATSSSSNATASRLATSTSPAGNIPSGASDQEKAALIMQVLQLSDEQIAMLPPEQRQSILVLKEQIAKSTQR